MNKKILEVLIIEDNPDDADLLEIMLSGSNSLEFSVQHVQRLKNAIDLVQKKNFDAILLDLSLPDSHGVETFISLHEVAGDIPILVLTGLSDEQFALDLVYKGAQDYLVKGQIDSALIIRSIMYAIERNQLKLELQKTRELEAEAQKLRIANQLAGTIAHEFNNPLAIIKGNADLLHMMQKSEKTEQLTQKINEQVERMRELVEKLLTIEELHEIDYAKEMKIYDIHINNKKDK